MKLFSASYEGVFIDCKKVIANYRNFRASTYQKGMSGFDGEEQMIWKQTFENFRVPRKRLKVLDVGTGPGFLVIIFAEMGHEVTGIDISEAMLENAKNNADNMGLEISLFHGDAENLPFEDCYFDLVVNKYLLWTLQEPSRAIKEWKRALKPGGMGFAIDSNWFTPRTGISKECYLSWQKSL